MSSKWKLLFALCILALCMMVTGVFASEECNHDIDWYDYQSDTNYHWNVCNICGEAFDKQEHMAACYDPTVCEVCGRSDVVIGRVGHYGQPEEIEYDDDSHWFACPSCGEQMKGKHCVPCGNGTRCVVCRLQVGPEYIEHYESSENPGYCENCGKKLQPCDTHDWVFLNDYENHWQECSACGKISGFEAHNYSFDQYVHDDETHWMVCADCGVQTEPQSHVVNSLGECSVCGATGLSIAEDEHVHNYVEFFDANKHGLACSLCGDVRYADEHWTSCSGSRNYCAECSGTVAMGIVFGFIQHDYYPDDPSWFQADGTSHWYTCYACDETVIHQHEEDENNPGYCYVCDHQIIPECTTHDWSEQDRIEPTCTEEGSVTLRCLVCGATETQELPKLGHSMTVTDYQRATCTTAGYRNSACTVCNMTESTTLNAFGHSFDTETVSNNDGTHYVPCLNCGYHKTANCSLVTYTVGNMLNHVCSMCAYVEIEPIAVEGADENIPADAPATMVAVSDWKIDAGEDNLNEDGAPIIRKDAIITVTELVYTNEEELVMNLVSAASEEISATVKKVFVVSMTVDGNKAQPNKGVVSLTIAIDEEEYALLTSAANTKLVMMLQDGTIIDVEYEFVDGKLVFTTENFGVFMLVECSEEEQPVA